MSLLNRHKPSVWCLAAPIIPQDHRLFRDQYGRISICDLSGTNPDLTDDGPLIVLPKEPVTITSLDRCIVRVAPERGHAGDHVSLSLANLRHLFRLCRENGDKLKIEVDGELRDKLDLIDWLLNVASR